jgi:hypothetical protein
MRFVANSAEPKRIVSLLKYDWQYFLPPKVHYFLCEGFLVILHFVRFDERAYQPDRPQDKRIVEFRATIPLGLTFFWLGGMGGSALDGGRPDTSTGLEGGSLGLEMPTTRNTFQ